MTTKFSRKNSSSQLKPRGTLLGGTATNSDCMWRGNWKLESLRLAELQSPVKSVRSDDGFVQFSDWIGDKPLMAGAVRREGTRGPLPNLWWGVLTLLQHIKLISNKLHRIINTPRILENLKRMALVVSSNGCMTCNADQGVAVPAASTRSDRKRGRGRHHAPWIASERLRGSSNWCGLPLEIARLRRASGRKLGAAPSQTSQMALDILKLSISNLIVFELRLGRLPSTRA